MNCLLHGDWLLTSIQVCNSPELREVHNEMLPAVSAFFAKISLDPKLWNSLQAFSKKEEANSLNSIDKRLLDETMRDFQEAGADLQDDKRSRLEAISQELAKLTQKFSEQVLDATNEWKIVVKDEDKLKGLPESAKEAARQTAIEKLGEDEGKDAWVFTLHTPPCYRYCNTWKMITSARKFGRQVIACVLMLLSVTNLLYAKLLN